MLKLDYLVPYLKFLIGAKLRIFFKSIKAFKNYSKTVRKLNCPYEPNLKLQFNPQVTLKLPEFQLNSKYHQSQTVD